ncbi:nicotinate-nucleotide adenylyltransferase [Mangrovicoccus algicola]|uniref:Probable nicotinate-nucleotide adenylyltransferase n=1 Tax=Mangrovicoccus algicola TaxID=2771008 RepID=A0A8J6YT43_9RHOB|nr:nicotinate-nucleotide adenylyltransferase [Mangrovicoccus algicola]MBE3636967.1 nicotinate-nucleotide adenylyltransferase [Mangrovicoccus algicola]
MRHVIGPGRPLARPGQVIGLLGGSFDPPHEGHVHVTLEAMKRFRLDRVWWLVSPGNPLKREGPAELPRRMAAAKAMVGGHPRITVTDIESRLGTRYTAQTLQGLAGAYPGVRFVWLMGEDNLAGIHRWDRWQAIFDSVPIGVLARPGQPAAARTARASRLYRGARLGVAAAGLLARAPAPAWCHLPIPLRSISSTAIRASGNWVR